MVPNLKWLRNLSLSAVTKFWKRFPHHPNAQLKIWRRKILRIFCRFHVRRHPRKDKLNAPKEPNQAMFVNLGTSPNSKVSTWITTVNCLNRLLNRLNGFNLCRRSKRRKLLLSSSKSTWKNHKRKQIKKFKNGLKEIANCKIKERSRRKEGRNRATLKLISYRLKWNLK